MNFPHFLVRYVLLSLLISPSLDAKAADFATPIKYTASLMAVEFALLHALDLAEDDVRSTNFENVLDDPAPEKDDDSYLINYGLHPLMGSETYLRARESDFGVAGSLAFSMAASVTWEYLIESWTEHPSVQDLVVTTGIGWMLGELRHQLKQECIREGTSYTWVDPIWSALEYFNFSITRDSKGYAPTVMLTFSM